MKKNFFTKKKIIIFSVFAAIVIGGIVYFNSNGKGKVSYVTDVVQKKDLLQTVSEVGTVESPSQINLNFSVPGKLSAKLAGAGDAIKTGEVLAQLDIAALAISRDQAAANLAQAQSNLTKLLQGATAAQLAVAQAQVDQAGAAYASAVDNLNKTNNTVAEDISQAQGNLSDLQGITATSTFEQAVSSAQTVLANAKINYQKIIDNSTQNTLNDITGKLSTASAAMDNINSIVTDDSIKDFLSSQNKTYLVTVKSDYILAKSLLSIANSSFSAALNNKNQKNIDQAAFDLLALLNKISDAQDNLYNALIYGSINNQTVLNADKASVSSQTAAISAAINIISVDQQNFDNSYLTYSSNVQAAQNGLDSAQAAWNNAITAAKNALALAKVGGSQKISAAQNGADTASQTLSLAQKQLAQIKSPARSADVVSAQAQVSGAQASLDLVNNQINNDTITSPIDGQVVKDNYTVGEQTNIGTPVFSVLAVNDLEISVEISESDIAKIKTNDTVQITLDAFGPDKKFNGVAYFIDPAATVIQDVTYYRVKIKFTDATSTVAVIKPGMTANVTIITDNRTGVLTVPERAVIAKADGNKIVRVLEKGKVSEVPVKTGLRGDDGSIEITEGKLTIGQTVVVFINTK
jgi:RND family efflux transporter MFP subunit